MEILKNPNFPFMKTRGIAGAISLALIVIGLASMIAKGGPKYSIDFTGGSILQIQFAQSVHASDVREALDAVGQGDASIQEYGAGGEVLVRVPNREGGAAVESVKEALRAKWPDLTVRREDTVGPKIGSELRKNAGKAIFWSLLGILVYVSVRFQFRFAVAGVVALIHDVLVTLGLFSLTGREVSSGSDRGVPHAGRLVDQRYDRDLRPNPRESARPHARGLRRARESEHQPVAGADDHHVRDRISRDRDSLFLRRRSAARLLFRDARRWNRGNVLHDLDRFGDPGGVGEALAPQGEGSPGPSVNRGVR